MTLRIDELPEVKTLTEYLECAYSQGYYDSMMGREE